MPELPFWSPTVEDLLHVYEMHIGDPRALRDASGFEAAVAAPWQSVGGEDAYPTVHLKAAKLYTGIDRRQAFVDGNKRIAFFATRLHYGYRGIEFRPPTDEFYGLAMEVAVMQPIDLEYVAAKFARWCEPIADPPD